MAAPTVVHTVGGLDPITGGPARTVPALCQAIAEQGATTHVVTRAVGRCPDIPGVTMTRVRSFHGQRLRMIVTPRFASSLAGVCRLGGAQIIHDHGVWLSTNHAAAKVAQQLTLPLVVSPRGMLEPWSLRYKGWKKWVAWRLYQRSDLHTASLLVATSQQEADNLRSVGLRQPIAVIPNGVDIPRLEPAVNLDTHRMREVLFLSRLHPKKGILPLLHAWDRVRPEGWRLTIVGSDEGGHRAEVERLIRALGLGNDVMIQPAAHGAAKSAWYGRADLFVLPSHSENFGVVVAEALAHGVPVITTRNTPWACVETHDCGWWVKDGVDDLAGALAEAVALDDRQRHAMGTRGRRLADRDFSWRHIAVQTLTAYRWVLNNGDRPEWLRVD